MIFAMTNTAMLHPGQALTPCEIQISQALIDAYAAISGDFNPIHIDPAAGQAAGFGGSIAHGCLPLEPVLQSLRRWSGFDSLPQGTRLTLRYRAPSRPGDTIRSSLVFEERADGSLRFAFECKNQSGQTVLDGHCLWPVEGPWA